MSGSATAPTCDTFGKPGPVAQHEARLIQVFGWPLTQRSLLGRSTVITDQDLRWSSYYLLTITMSNRMALHYRLTINWTESKCFCFVLVIPNVILFAYFFYSGFNIWMTPRMKLKMVCHLWVVAHNIFVGSESKAWVSFYNREKQTPQYVSGDSVNRPTDVPPLPLAAPTTLVILKFEKK